MKHIEVYTAGKCMLVLGLFILMLSGGLMAAEAADSKAIFTVQ